MSITDDKIRRLDSELDEVKTKMDEHQQIVSMFKDIKPSDLIMKIDCNQKHDCIDRNMSKFEDKQQEMQIDIANIKATIKAKAEIDDRILTIVSEQQIIIKEQQTTAAEREKATQIQLDKKIDSTIATKKWVTVSLTAIGGFVGGVVMLALTHIDDIIKFFGG